VAAGWSRRLLLPRRLRLEISVFFLVRISFFTWFVGNRAVLLASAFRAGLILAANLTSPAYAQYPRVGSWNARSG
jgi:hypothetical protein